MTISKVRVLFATLALLLLISCRSTAVSCQDPLGCITLRPNDPIQFAYLLPFGGNAIIIGEEMARGIEIAIVSRDSLLLDHPIQIIPFDTNCDVETGKVAAENAMSNSQIVALFGPACSNVAYEVAPLVFEAGGVMVSPGATAVQFTPSQLATEQTSLFRTIPDYTEQAQTAAQYARTYLGAETAVIINNPSTQSSEITERFASVFEWLGGTIIAEETLPNDLDELLTILESSGSPTPDLIYLPLYAPEANLVLNKLVELHGERDVVLMGIDTLYIAQFPLQAGSASTGLYLTGTAVQGESHGLFLGSWLSQYGTLPQTIYPPFAYDAFELVAEAVESVATVNNQGELIIGKSALRDAIAQTKNYNGLTGRLSCEPMGNCSSTQTLNVFQFTADVVNGDLWPPPAAPRGTLAP